MRIVAILTTVIPLISAINQFSLPIPVKRVHSRQRRFIAPGAVWDLMIGIESIGSDFEFRYDIVSHYNLDYLFGGTTALATAIAAANAAITASNQVRLAAQAAGKKRKRRSVVGQNNIVAALGRSFSTDDDIGNLLTRTIIDDQIDVLGKIEAAMDKSGIPGKPCVLRAICELTETPIHHWSIFGEMITNLLRPKNGSHVTLEEYKKAEKIGEEQGDCWSFYPECAFSIFNIIPDVYTTDDHVEVTFDGFESGSKFNQTDGKVDEDLMNMIKDEVKIVSEHKVDIDLTT